MNIVKFNNVQLYLMEVFHMSKVIVLGGCGAVGSVAVKTLANQDMFSKPT